MHIRTKVKDLTSRQFKALDGVLQTNYEFPEGVTRVCVVFEAAPMVERHVEMPLTELAQVVYLLDLLERGALVAEAALGETTGPGQDGQTINPLTGIPDSEARPL